MVNFTLKEAGFLLSERENGAKKVAGESNAEQSLRIEGGFEKTAACEEEHRNEELDSRIQSAIEIQKGI